MNFKAYSNELRTRPLREAEQAIELKEDFRESDLIKVGTLITKIASRKLGVGKFFFILKEDFKKVTGEKGVGALFASEGGTLMRFNYLTTTKRSYSVNSIDVWQGRKIGDAPSKSLTFQGKNIVKVVDELMDAIKGLLKESTSDLDGSYNEFEDINEATAKERYEARLEFALAHGIKPSYARSAKVLRTFAEKAGVVGLFDQEFGGAITVQTDVAEKTSTMAKISEDEKQLGASGIYSDPKFVFDDMVTAAKTVADGNWRSAIFAGQAGVGKTYSTKQMLTQSLGPYSEGPDSKWAYYTGAKVTPLGLYQILLLNSKKLIVFDDSNSILLNGDTVEMLKSANADEGERIISWSSKATANVSLMSTEQREQYEMEYKQAVMEDPNTTMKAPSSFVFDGSMVIITNLPAKKIDDALKSRAIFIDLYMAERDVIRRMYTIKKHQGLDDAKILMLLEAVVPNPKDALEGKGKYAGKIKYITPEDARKSKDLNMRSLNIAEALLNSGAARWKEMSQLYA